MEQKALIFGEQCTNKNAFHENKKPISINKVETKRIVLSKKDSYAKKGSFKYYKCIFIYPILLFRKISQMNGYVKYFNDSKYMNLLGHNK